MLNLLFVDGFDVVDFFMTALKYSVSIPFLQGSIQTGRRGTGGAMLMQNTASATVTYSRAFTQQNEVFLCTDFQITDSNHIGDPTQAQTFIQQVFFIVGNSTGPTPLFQMRVNNDGTLSVLDGAGSVLGSTVNPIVKGQWYFLEINVIYGTGGSFEIWLEGAKVIHGTANLTTTFPNEFTIEWSSTATYSLMLDNLHCYGSAADPLTARNGPARVTGMPIFAITRAGGWTSTGRPTLVEAVADRSSAGYATVPDGDVSYDSPGVTELMGTIQKSPCFGLVWGVAVNLCARPIGGSTFIDAVVQQRQAIVTIGSNAVVDTGSTLVPGNANLFGYATYQAITTENNQGQTWNDLQIQSANWGAQAGGALALTQIYLEKLTDLTGKAFGCGQASYAF